MQKSILIVEDEPLIALDLQAMLETHGWRVVGPAATLERALQYLEDDPPSVALLGIDIRGQKVTPVAEVLKHWGIPFAVATGYGHSEMAEVFKGIPHVRKPTDELELLIVLACLLTA